MGVPETTVCSVLKREKKAGNPLAVRTHENPRAPKPEPVVHIYQKIALLRNKGLTTGQIGALLDRSPKAIRSAERFARNREKRAP
jgi:hypothetical protein